MDQACGFMPLTPTLSPRAGRGREGSERGRRLWQPTLSPRAGRGSGSVAAFLLLPACGEKVPAGG